VSTVTGTWGKADEELLVDIIALIDMIPMRTFSRGATRDAYFDADKGLFNFLISAVGSVNC
jgi:hypothetical protein